MQLHLKSTVFCICILYASKSYCDNESADYISDMQLQMMQEEVVNVSKNQFGCEEPKLQDRKITHYTEPKIRNGLTMKEGTQHELWQTDVCGRNVTFGFVAKVAPDRKDSASLGMSYTEINEKLLENPNIDIQNKYSKLIIGEWEPLNNGENDYFSSSTYDIDNRHTFSWKNGNSYSGKIIHSYELIGDVLCHTVIEIEQQNTATPIGFKQCSKIEEVNTDYLVFKSLDNNLYKQKRVK